MATLSQMIEHCEECGAVLEIGQIGLCSDCQDAAQQSISTEQAASAAKLAFESAKTRWSARVAAGQGTECLIESTDIFGALSQLSLPCTDCAEGLVEDALSDLGFYTQAADAFNAFQSATGA